MRNICILLICFIVCWECSSFTPKSVHRRVAGNKFQMQLQTDASAAVSTSNSPPVRTVLSALDTVKKSGFKELETLDYNSVNLLLSLAVDGKSGKEAVTSKTYQRTNGPVPRSYLPSLLVIDRVSDAEVEPTAIFSLVEESLKWFFDCGGRASRIEVATPASLSTLIESMGFHAAPSQDSVHAEVTELRKSTKRDDLKYFVVDAEAFVAHCEARVAARSGDLHVLNDILGRLAHDMGNPKAAIKPYTAALQAFPESAAAFRNMGSAYHASGEMQLAFASYQQAVTLDETDALVYLKLAFFYEDFATKDWPDAAEHSQRCYEYYLDKVDPGDTGVLTRLGNLMVREHKYEKAIEVYSRILSLDSSLENVWFNKAHAQISAGDTAGATESLKRTLEIDPTITAARHMLKALTDDEAASVSKPDDAYVKDLFDSYATVYDSHVKKLLYSATRVIRQELAKVYRNKFGIFDGRYVDAASLQDPSAGEAAPAPSTAGACLEREGHLMDDPVDFKEADTPVHSGCSTYTSFMNGSLDILDIGCGTGIAGAWMKDYARTLVGVDLSEEMVKVAAKKQLYQELHVQPLNDYLAVSNKTFDLVVAADVLSYVGDLTTTFNQVAKVLRPGGHFAFTAETAPSDSYLSERGYRLMRNGCFGYSKKYIDDLVASLEPKFNIQLSRDFSPRLDAGEPVPGFLYIIQKAE